MDEVKANVGRPTQEIRFEGSSNQDSQSSPSADVSGSGVSRNTAGSSKLTLRAASRAFKPASRVMTVQRPGFDATIETIRSSPEELPENRTLTAPSEVANAAPGLPSKTTTAFVRRALASEATLRTSILRASSERRSAPSAGRALLPSTRITPDGGAGEATMWSRGGTSPPVQAR